MNSDFLAQLSRRRFLGSVGRVAGAAALAPVLAACDALGGGGSPQRPPRDWDSWWKEQQQQGTLDFANWPYYIDRTRDNTHPSLVRFTAETGIGVDYYRPIRDDAAFLDLIRPALRASRPIGYDIIVITNGPQLSELIHNRWLTLLDQTRLQTFRRYAGPAVQDPPWDPGNRYTVAWQSGLTGIAYRPEAVDALGRPPSSIRDLWDPVFKGRVGMLRDLMDLGSFGLLALHIDPAASGEASWLQAQQFLLEQRGAGLVRRYFDQGYLGALQRGETWISQAWSGDIFQANQLGHPELTFVVPDEGAIFWTDNMMIPRGAAHPVDAMTYMDFVYRPAIAAMIADWVWYITPVPAARPIIKDRYGDVTVANSPLVFPKQEPLGSEGTTSNTGSAFDTGSQLRTYPVLSDWFERNAWQRTFSAVLAP